MDVLQKEKAGKGWFYINDNEGREIGAMHYTHSMPSEIVIDHTEVAERFEGRGIGRQLLNAAVKYARDHNYKIIPVCPYAKSVFDKTPEIRDVLKA